MARRKKFSIDDIIEAAFCVVRQSGMDHLTARSVALELNSSTMPIYSCVSAMREIEEAVVKKAWRVLYEYQVFPRSGDIYIDMGLGYVLFSKEEKYLFKCIHDDTYEDINTALSEENFEFHFQRLKDYPLMQKLSVESTRKLMFHGFLFSHGFASLLNSGIGSTVRMLNSEKAITAFFKEASEISWKGLKSAIK
jgi:hypothetical protein